MTVVERVGEMFAWTPRVGVYGHIWDDPEKGRFDVIQGFEADGGERKTVAVLRVSEEETVMSLLEKAGEKAFVLLDAHDPNRAGGTGKVVDWGLAAEFRAMFSGRVVLAGGLGPENVAEAVRRVRPYGVDASSGLESSPGVKDSEKLKKFIVEAKNG